MNKTITITGLRAAAIERANNASFYGIYGTANACISGRIAAEDAVWDDLKETGTTCAWFDILSAKTIDTTGTKTPYKAVIKYRYE